MAELEKNDKSKPAAPDPAQGETPLPQATGTPAGNESTNSRTSEKKKNSNRNNSKHSTGPKTKDGKTRIKYNALKYGLFARDIVIPRGDAKEDPEAFNLLLVSLERAWEPTDAMEYMLVRTIAECEWRQRRGCRAEIGEILRRTDPYYARLQIDELVESGVAFNAIQRPPGVPTPFEKATLMTAQKYRGQMVLLKAVREQIVEQGCVGDPIQQKLDSVFGKRDEVAFECHRLSKLVESEEREKQSISDDEEPDQESSSEDHEGDESPVESLKSYLLSIIELKEIDIRRFVTEVQEAEAREKQAKLLACNLPPQEFVETLIRFDASLERKKQNAITWLMKRKGIK